MVIDYDVVILGGGPAGCATALALRQQRVDRLLVAESGGYDKDRIGESIPPDSALLLKELRLWDAFLAQGHEPCLGTSSSWGSRQIGYNDSVFNPHGHGWHLDRRRFDAFVARAAGEAGAEVRTRTRFEGCQARPSGGFLLSLCTDRQRQAVGARFVVDATGLGARFARRQGARRRYHDRLFCVTAFFQPAERCRFSRLTFLEAVEYGWWYAARLPGRRLAVALASDPRIIRAAGATRRQGWLRRLHDTVHLARELEGADFVSGSLRACMASSSLLDRTAGEGWLAVGDAASTYDPISSQGIHKALADGLLAAPVIASCLKGDDSGLSEYGKLAARRFARYLAARDYYYALEQRWPESPFWRQRRDRSSAQGRKGLGRSQESGIRNQEEWEGESGFPQLTTGN